jgi:YVTN family beta-propeller protein
MAYALKATVAVQDNPVPVLYSNGSIWVGNTGSGSIQRIDPATNTVIATITGTGLTVSPTSLAEDDLGNVWVACNDFTSGSVSRIDPATNTITASLYTADGYRPIGLGMGAGEMWASFAVAGGVYVRFDTTTLAETFGSGIVGYGYNFVDDGTNVWFDDGVSCNKVDPATNTITSITSGIVSGGFGFLHYAFGYVWRSTGSGIQRVNPSTNALTTITLSGVVYGGITDDGTDLIVADINGEIFVVDPTSFAVKQTISSSDFYSGATFGSGSIWANKYGSNGSCKRFSPIGVGWVRGHAWG